MLELEGGHTKVARVRSVHTLAPVKDSRCSLIRNSNILCSSSVALKYKYVK